MTLNGGHTVPALAKNAGTSSHLPNGADASTYKVLEQPLGTINPVRIITIGAGASGINMAHQVNLYMKNVDHVVYEKNGGVGGTWYENRYPGCKCDIRMQTSPILQHFSRNT